MNRWLLPILASLFLLAPASAFEKRDARTPAIPSMGVQDLPPEARVTLKLIKQGGPFPYSKDGTIFGNRERLLPSKARGYYKEYTVATPKLKHRGARRIVAGQPGEYYYTEDHYASFKRIQE